MSALHFDPHVAYQYEKEKYQEIQIFIFKGTLSLSLDESKAQTEKVENDKKDNKKHS